MDVDHIANEWQQQQQQQQQQQPGVLLSICPTPEADIKADQPEGGEPPHGSPAEQLDLVGMTNAAPVLGDARPTPDQEQCRAAAEKRQHEVSVNDPQHAEALPMAAAASAAHVYRDASAKSSDVATQHTGEQHGTSAPNLLTDKQLAGRQPEAAKHVEIVNNMSIVCNRTPPTEAVSVQQQADAAASSPDQEELPSMQCAMYGPAQETCTDTQQLADGAADSCAAGQSQHGLTCDHDFQGLSNSIPAGEAVYPGRDEGSYPQQMAGDSPMAHDAFLTDDALVAGDASLADHAPIADDAATAGYSLGADDTPMADDSATADDAPGTDETPMADASPTPDLISMADGIPMAGHTPLVGPAEGSSKAVSPSIQAQQGDVVRATLQADPQEQEAHVEPHQQNIDGRANLEQGASSNQLEHQMGVTPSSAVCASDLPASAGQDTAEGLLMSMSETPDNSGIVPDSEEPNGDLIEAVATQLQGISDHTLVDTANQDKVSVHVPHSNDQALHAPHQHHSAAEDLSSTSSVGEADAANHAATLAPGAQGNLQRALSNLD